VDKAVVSSALAGAGEGQWAIVTGKATDEFCLLVNMSHGCVGTIPCQIGQAGRDGRFCILDGGETVRKRIILGLLEHLGLLPSAGLRLPAAEGNMELVMGSSSPEWWDDLLILTSSIRRRYLVNDALNSLGFNVTHQGLAGRLGVFLISGGVCSMTLRCHGNSQGFANGEEEWRSA
jgi:hypothetical protein